MRQGTLHQLGQKHLFNHNGDSYHFPVGGGKFWKLDQKKEQTQSHPSHPREQGTV